MAAEVDVLGILGTRHLPRITVLEPVVRFLDLAAVHDLLAEDAVVVAEPVAHAGEVQRRHRVDVARGETAKAAVAESRVGLVVSQAVPVDAVFLQRLAAELVGLQVDDVVAEKSANQELERHVVDALRVLARVLLLRGDPAFDEPVADGHCKRGVFIALRRARVALCERVPEVPGEVVLKPLDRHFHAAVFPLMCLLFHLASSVCDCCLCIGLFV